MSFHFTSVTTTMQLTYRVYKLHLYSELLIGLVAGHAHTATHTLTHQQT